VIGDSAQVPLNAATVLVRWQEGRPICIDWVKVLCPIQQKMGHFSFRTCSPSQSLGLGWKNKT